MERSTLRGILPLGAVIILAAGCKDLLPEYRAPESVLSVRFSAVDTHVVRFTMDELDATVANYSVYENKTTVPFTVTYVVRNDYEETIQTEAKIKGEVTVWALNNTHPDFRSVYNLSPADLERSSAYNRETGILTLSPGAEITLQTKISFRCVNLTYLHAQAVMTGRTIRKNVFGRLYYDITFEPLKVGSRIVIQLYDKGGILSAEQTFVVHLRGYVPIN